MQGFWLCAQNICTIDESGNSQDIKNSDIIAWLQNFGIADEYLPDRYCISCPGQLKITYQVVMIWQYLGPDPRKKGQMTISQGDWKDVVMSGMTMDEQMLYIKKKERCKDALRKSHSWWSRVPTSLNRDGWARCNVRYWEPDDITPARGMVRY